MTANTKIEWADHTFNPWVGCTKVSPGCDNCYAEAWAMRFKRSRWGAEQPRVRTSANTWREPFGWNMQAIRQGRRAKVFCASLADLFDNEVPTSWRADLFDLIAQTPHLDWLLLTKRIGNAKTLMADALHLNPAANRDGMIYPLPNVWLGATVVNQEEADRDIPKLLATPAAKRFLSIEPMLGPVDLDCWPESGCGRNWIDDDPSIDWVIVGGESGPHARPMHPDWARSLRDQCTSAGVPFFFKQWGEWAQVDEQAIHPKATRIPGNLCRVTRDGVTTDHYSAVSLGAGHKRYVLQRVGKKAAGRLLDGRTWDEVPG